MHFQIPAEGRRYKYYNVPNDIFILQLFGTSSQAMRDAVVPVDQEVLDQALKQHQSWVNVGAYETLSKAQAANGDELAKHFDLLQCLLHIQPKGELLLTQVRSAIVKVVTLTPKLNTSGLQNLLWAGGRYEKLSTMLHHLRRCKNSPDKLRQLVAKANGSAAEQVQQLLAILSAEEVAAVGEQNTVGQPLKKLKSLSTKEAETQEAQSESAAAKNTEEQEVPKTESQSAVEKDLEVKQELKTVVKTVATPQNKRKLEAETAASQEKKEPKDTIFYRKEYYKADNKFGFKRFEAGQKPKQIFSCGHAKIPKPELQKLAGKILNDLHKCCGHRPKEEEIELVAKHKVWKMSQSYQGVA